MVHKTGLRIGNLLRLNASFSRYLFVKEITAEVVHFDKGYVLKFNETGPVPITPGLLTKAGFIFGRKFCGADFYDLKLKSDFFGAAVWEFKRNNESLTDVQYIHQLQNLYYAISGEELKITI